MANAPLPASSPATRAPRSRLPLMIGLMAFAGGVWLLLDSYGMNIPPFKRMWPVVPGCVPMSAAP